ncbi:U3 small nucleolar RNA-associated protein 18 homolog [Argentina anserina]|uniref:U3 small nucleolar RNA-associated protein 18 homolog n=1 Tax=Argentina anserina TaxID=57926 RepID=UPI0021768841|nr:U3 small nucleolar RNA-associated protein 18 homolog [Potentilla anserina]
MSLISQNVPSALKSRKSKREVPDEPACMQANDGNEDGKEMSLDVMRVNKRNKARNEVDEKDLVEQEKEMKKLESFLFGNIYAPVEFGKEDEEEAGDAVDNCSSLFFVDRSANNLLIVDEDDGEVLEEETKQRKAVWEDDEEAKANVNIAKVNRLRKLRKEEDESLLSGSKYVSRLRAQHVKLNPGTEWAQLDSEPRSTRYSDDESSDDDYTAVAAHGYKDVGAVDDLLRTNEDFVVKSSSKLLPGLLEYSILTDANAEEPSNGPINSVQFHRNAQLLLTAGLDRRLRFF